MSLCLVPCHLSSCSYPNMEGRKISKKAGLRRTGQGRAGSLLFFIVYTFLHAQKAWQGDTNRQKEEQGRRRRKTPFSVGILRKKEGKNGISYRMEQENRLPPVLQTCTTRISCFLPLPFAFALFAPLPFPHPCPCLAPTHASKTILLLLSIYMTVWTPELRLSVSLSLLLSPQ